MISHSDKRNHGRCLLPIRASGGGVPSFRRALWTEMPAHALCTLVPGVPGLLFLDLFIGSPSGVEREVISESLLSDAAALGSSERELAVADIVRRRNTGADAFSLIMTQLAFTIIKAMANTTVKNGP